MTHQTGRFSLTAGDVWGGVASGLVSVTGNVAAGVIAFAPLGPEYARYGILAGMLASIVPGVVGALAGGAPGLIAGPKATTATAVAALLTHLLATGRFDTSTPEDVGLLLSFGFAAVALAGGFQVLLGGLRAGAVAKFMPYPVVAGIRNTTAVVLILSQLWPLMGVPRQSFASFLAQPGQFQPATFLVGVSAAWFALRGKRFVPRAAVPVVALLLGTAVHYALAWALPDARLGVTLGTLPDVLPPPNYAPGILAAVGDPANLELLGLLVSGALAITVLETVLSLTTLVSYQSLADRRFDGNRQLISQGVGTAVGALVGSLPSSGILARAATNVHAGGRSLASNIVNALTVLVLVVVLAEPFGWLPKAAVAGLIVVIAAGLFDRWTLAQLRESLRSDAQQRRDNVVNVLVIATVLVVGVWANLIVAVGVGVALSVVLFVAEMSRSPILRVRSGAAVRSTRIRDEQESRLLKQHGHRIALVELEGTIFFGSCDAVATRVEALAEEGAEFVVLDLRRVRTVDATGFKVLGQTFQRLRRRGVTLAYSQVAPGGPRADIAEDLILNGVPEARLFESTDRALEYFEDGILLRHAERRDPGRPWTLEDFARAWAVDDTEVRPLEAHLDAVSFRAGETIFQAGGTDRAMLLVCRGTGEILLPGADGARRRRVATFGRGALVGEMALLDGGPRAAAVVASEPVEGYLLRHDAFTLLQKEHPGTALLVQEAILRTLGQRLRGANAQILELEQ